MNCAIKCTLLAMFFTPLTAAAVTDSELAKCAAITSTQDRLLCFDAIAKKVQPTENSSDSKADKNTNEVVENDATDAAESVGNWEVSSNIDPMTDKHNYLAGLKAKSGEGMFGKPIYLGVRCEKNKTEAFIIWNTILGIGDSPKVTYRLDKGKPKSSSWNKSTDSQGTFFPGSPIAFLKQLIETKTLVASVHTFSNGELTAVFDLTGIEIALKDIRKECKW